MLISWCTCLAGPWQIVALLPGASYALKFGSDLKWHEKKHASNLLPYPPELIPFQPGDGPDKQYSKLYKPIGKSPFKEAGINGAECCGNFLDFHFPTLSELNNKFKPFPWLNDDKQCQFLLDDVIKEEPILYNGPPPSPAVIQAPPVPPTSLLIRSIIKSSDRLFFVSHSLGNLSIQERRLICVAFSNSPIPILLTGWTIPCRVLYIAFLWCLLQCNKPALLVTVPLHWWDCYANIIYDDASYLPIRLVISSCSKAKVGPISLLVESHTFRYVPPWSVWICIRQWIETHNRISKLDWDVLSCQASQFQNPLPKFDLPSISTHADQEIHVTICNPFHVSALCAAADFNNNCIVPWQKVLGTAFVLSSSPFSFCSQKGIPWNQLRGLQVTPIPSGNIV